MTRTSTDCRLPLRSLIIVAALTGSLTAPASPPSPSDVASAKSLVIEGRELRAKDDKRAALAKFKAAYALVQTPIIGLDLARSHEAVGELIESREVCVEAARLPVTPKETSEGKKARAECESLAADLVSRIASLTLIVTSDPTPDDVEVDGLAIPIATLGVARKINPGRHTVYVRVGTREATQDVTVTEGSPAIVRITVPRPIPGMRAERATVDDPKPVGSWSTVRVTGAVVGAVGALATIGFGVWWGVTQSTLTKRFDECTRAQGAECSRSAFPRESAEGVDSARDARDLARLATGISGLVFAGGIVLFALAPAPGGGAAQSKTSTVAIGISPTGMTASFAF